MNLYGAKARDGTGSLASMAGLAGQMGAGLQTELGAGLHTELGASRLTPRARVRHTKRVTEQRFDPRDPRGLRADAPMLAAWLDFPRQAEAGLLLPMGVPGHKQRQDLVGSVIAGDSPFYAGLDTIKHADVLRV